MTQVSKHKRKSALLNLRNSFKNLLLSNSGMVKGNAKSDEISENRFSVLYKYKSQYHHIGCSSQSQAQSTLGVLMTDGDRIPVGIYDAKTDLFEWEIVGQYFHSQDPISEQSRRLEEVLNIARALRRRDSSWQPGYLQKPSFFA